MQFDYHRRFGNEIEINSFSGDSHPRIEGELPEGIGDIASMVSQTLNCRCEIYDWYGAQRVVDSDEVWIVKPDGSCGMEICSPISKGLRGIYKNAEIIDALKKSGLVKADKRCSLHIHVEIADLKILAIATVLAHWVKCEYTMLLSMPDHRKKNRYCQPIGMSDLLQADSILTPETLVNRLGAYKYYTVNTFHYNRGKLLTMEFRIADEQACLDAIYFRNWNKLILHFVEMSSKSKYPSQYNPSDVHSGYLWLYPDDVLKFLSFDRPELLCSELRETRNWLIDRISLNSKSNLGGVWDEKVTSRIWNIK